MLLPQTTRISIETGIEYFTAVYKRVYRLDVHARDGQTAVITVKSEDCTPSGYVRHGSQKVLIECEEIAIPSGGLTSKGWLAKLAIQHDQSLNQRTGCEYLNRSVSMIKSHLTALTKSEVI